MERKVGAVGRGPQRLYIKSVPRCCESEQTAPNTPPAWPVSRVRECIYMAASIAPYPSSIRSSLPSSSFTVSMSFFNLFPLFGDKSRAMASHCADLASSPISRYTFASWNTTFDSSGDESRSLCRSSTASCESPFVLVSLQCFGTASCLTLCRFIEISIFALL